MRKIFAKFHPKIKCRCYLSLSSSKEDTLYIRAELGDSSRIDDILDVIAPAVYPTGRLSCALSKSTRTIFHPSPVEHVSRFPFNQRPSSRNRFLARLTRHLEANDFPFPVKHSVAFPFDPSPLSLSLSLCTSTHPFHIFSQIVGSLWLEADRIDCF